MEMTACLYFDGQVRGNRATGVFVPVIFEGFFFLQCRKQQEEELTSRTAKLKRNAPVATRIAKFFGTRIGAKKHFIRRSRVKKERSVPSVPL